MLCLLGFHKFTKIAPTLRKCEKCSRIEYLDMAGNWRPIQEISDKHNQDGGLEG